MRRANSIIGRSIEEKKEHLFIKQASDYLYWIQEFLECPPFQDDLLPALKSGFVLCQIVKKIDPDIAHKVPSKFKHHLKESKIPNLFQAMENLLWFLEACKLLGIKEVDLFQADDLVEEVNKLKVLRTLQVLRQLVDDTFVGVGHERSEWSFDTQFLAARPGRQSVHFSVRPLDPSIAQGFEQMASERRDRRRSMAMQRPNARIARPPTTSEEQSDETAPATTAPPAAEEIPAQSIAVQAPPLADDLTSTMPSQAPDVEAAPQPIKTDVAAVVPAPAPAMTDSGGVAEPEQAQAPTISITELPPPAARPVTPPPSAELASDTPKNDSFVEHLSDDIMMRLLSKRLPDDDYDSQLSDFDGDEGDSDDHALSDHHDEHHDDEVADEAEGIDSVEMLAERDRLIFSLQAEVESLNEVLKGEIVAHVREMEEAKEVIDEFAERARIAETRNIDLEIELQTQRDKNEELAEELQQKTDYYEDQLKELQAQLSAMTLRAEQLAAEAASAQAAAAAAAAATVAAAAAVPAPTSASVPTPAPDATAVSAPAPLAAEELSAKARPVSVSSTASTAASMSDALYKSADKILWSQQAQTLAKTLDAREVQRQEVMFELIDTEEAYVADLELVCRIFLTPAKGMLDNRTFTQEQLSHIFCNIESLRSVHAAFLKDLKERQTQSKGMIVRSIGDLLQKHFPGMSIYAYYCANQRRSNRVLAKVTSQCALFRSHLAMVQGYRECRRLGLSTFLLGPMQRLTKYPLILKTLLKFTPTDNADYTAVLKAHQLLSDILQEVEQMTKDVDEVERLVEVAEALAPAKADVPMPDLSDDPSRRMLYEGRLRRLRFRQRASSVTLDKKKMDELHCFLCSDMFLFTKVVAERIDEKLVTRYLLQVEPSRLGGFRVRDVSDEDNGIGVKNVFVVSDDTVGTVVLHTDSADEKRKWIEAFAKSGLLVDSLAPPSVPSADGAAIARVTPRRSTSEQALSEAEMPPLAATTSYLPKDTREVELPVPNITVGQLQDPEFDGYLRMKTQPFRSSGKYWLVLKDFVLYYFPSRRPSAKALGMIMLPSYTIANTSQGKHHEIQIVHPSSISKTYVLIVDSQEQLEIWVEALTHATLAISARRRYWA